MNDLDYRELTIKIDMIIEFLENHGGIGHEMYSFVCCQSGEEVSFEIVDVAMDIKNKIDCIYQCTDESLF